MLNLYYGRASRDFKKFLYEKISSNALDRHIILVPDQFTLQEERIAFEQLQVKGMMNVEIMSFSRLGSRILSDEGGGKRTYIDELGKIMILSKIASERASQLLVFKNTAKRSSFLKMLSSLISEMKQSQIEPKDLLHLEEEMGDSLLQRKLRDVEKIFSDYEACLLDKYIDTEDYIALFTQKVKDAALVKGAHVYIEGFDYYSKRTFQMMLEILKTAKSMSVSLVMDQNQGNDQDLFELGEKNVWQFKNVANKLGVKVNIEEIPYEHIAKHEEIVFLEKELYAYPNQIYKKEPKALQLYACSNFYTEAETIAIEIIKLVKEKGYRFRDIAVICNDMDTRGTIIKRTFREYGIASFIDKKRNVMHNPFVAFLIALFDTVNRGYEYEDIFRLVKSGIFSLDAEKCEDLENYVLRYKVRGNRWKKPFVKWDEREDEGTLKLFELNQVRETLVSCIETFEGLWEKGLDGITITKRIYDFLKKDINIETKITERVELFKAEGNYEYASETVQIWNYITSIFDQMIELLGTSQISRKAYGDMIAVAFENLEIGMIPSTIDQVIVGTMQRTRVGDMKALFIAGANDGMIPAVGNEEGIFHEKEKEYINGLGKECYKSAVIKKAEEKLAIYKMFSKPKEYFQISYATADVEGKEILPSQLIYRLKQIFPLLKEKKDYVSEGIAGKLIYSANGCLHHVSQNIRQWDEATEEEWKYAFNWLLGKKTFSLKMKQVRDGLLFHNEKFSLGEEIRQQMYGNETVMSPTRIERFSRCPFSHFIQYGIRPEERRVFEIKAPEIGFLFHEIIMKYSMEMEKQQRWKEIGQEECYEKVREILHEMAQQYKQGILLDDPISKYRYGRIEKVCCKTCWVMTSHIQQGNFQRFYFEMSFGRDSFLPPVTIECMDGKKVYLEGRIDRLDMMNQGDTEFIKIIDYKSGRDKVDYEEMVSGWKLQLMLYMNAAVSGFSKKWKDKDFKPAGIFYFKVGETSKEIESRMVSGGEALRKTVEDEMRKSFRMDGIVVDDIRVIDGIDNDFEGYSDIIKVRRSKDGQVKGTGAYTQASEQEFESLRNSVMELTQSLCSEILCGNAHVTPKKTNTGVTACTYCQYKTICRYDPALNI